MIVNIPTVLTGGLSNSVQVVLAALLLASVQAASSVIAALLGRGLKTRLA